MVQNNQIIKGSMLQVKVDGNILGFATSHSLSITTNTTEVSTKDHGDYPGIIAQNITWEVQCENLYSEDNGQKLMAIQKSKQLVTLIFAKVNYDPNDEKGIVGHNNTDGTSDWQVEDNEIILQGQAYITSFSINAPAGDNATASCTFTGNGSFDTDLA